MSKDPYRYFRVEARELLEQLGRGVLELERTAGAGNAAEVARLLRHAHTLKGAARVVRQREIADDTHAIEDLLEPLREGAPVARETIDGVLVRLDAITGRLQALGEPEVTANLAIVAPAAAPAGKASSPALAVPGAVPLLEVTRPSANTAELDGLLDGLAETHVQLDAIRRGIASAERAGLERGVVRELTRAAELLGRELRQSRDAAEQLRLTAAASLTTPLERTARDIARALAKRVRVELRGGELRLDTQILDGVLPALVQAVRNAVAHGLEPENVRLAAGKPGEGLLVISVERRGEKVAFAVTDDGRGVDLAAVRRAAIGRGAPPAEIAGLSDDDVHALLLRGGISTAAAVTDVSGRGVGLDVVREVAARLGGRVRLTSRAGIGTSVELLAPCSLTAVESLVLEAAGSTTTIPLDAVRRTVRVTAAELATTDHGLAVVHEGKVLPFLPLPRALRLAAPVELSRTWTTVIVDGGGGAQAAIGVDRLRGTASVVMRPLPALAPADPVIAGASLDAEGAPQLALDPAGLVAAAHLHAVGAADTPAARRPVLVIDDSLTTRMLEQSILESAGWPVDLATSGEEGLAMARAGDYALFLVDVEMPGIDGFTFIERVRADPALRHVPAVLVTSRDSPDDLRRGRAVGAQGHMIKNQFDQAALLALIDRLVSR